jgi:hypothetical protein
MMAAPNPWEKLKQQASELVPPVAVLREQAGLLTQATEGVIQGTVESEQSGRYTELTLSAVVPAMDNYSVGLLSVRHDVLLYPATVSGSWTDKGARRCSTKEELEEHVVATLSEEGTQKVVASLFAQATRSGG